jgi:hypothetical protein
VWSMPRSYLEDNWGDQVSSIKESVRRRLERGKLKISSVKIQCLMKTLQAGEDLACSNL